MNDVKQVQADAVAALDAIGGSDPEGAHYQADQIVLALVDPAVRAAYDRLAYRVAQRTHD